MFKKGFIFVVLLACSSLQSANAETPCQSIDTVLHSLSLVQEMQSEPGVGNHVDNIAALNDLADNISLSALIPSDAEQSFPSEGAVVSQYLSAIRDAASSSATGSAHMARSIKSYPVQDLSRSMQSLTRYWNCHPKDAAPPPDTATLQKVISFTKAPKGEFDGVSDGTSQPSSQKSNSSNPSVSRVVIDRDRPNVAAIVTEYSRIFYGIAALMILAAIYYFHRRSKRYKIREVRRIIHKPATARISRADHDIIIVDISRNGLKIRHPGMIESQRKLRIKINGVWYQANIKWANNMFAGVMFKKPINDLTFRSIVEP